MYSLYSDLYTQQEATRELEPGQRLTRLENQLASQELMIDLIENIVKDQVREKKFKQMKELSTSAYFSS